MRKLFAPEVVQTSNLDCGPASLKCLLEGFGTHVSYERLREACQTGVDGTSIDSIESVANQLGLKAEQVMLPVDHLLLPESKALPAIVVVKLPNGMTHFVVVWRRHGPMLQVMDPAIGRRWISCHQFANDIFCHTTVVPARAWCEFAASDDFRTALTQRLRRIGISGRESRRLRSQALACRGWRALGTLDAAARFCTALLEARGTTHRETARLLARLCENPDLIPSSYWSVSAAPQSDVGEAQLFMRGAVLVRAGTKRDAPASQGHSVCQDLGPELAAAVDQRPVSAFCELLWYLKQSESFAPVAIIFALALATAGVLVESLLFRALIDIAGTAKPASQRIVAAVAVLLFGAILLALELPVFCTFLGLGRQLETRLRIAFLSKLPKLGDRYFQSRLTSDMAERSHATHRVRQLPELARQLLRAGFALFATAGAIVWFTPSAAGFILAIVIAAIVPVFATQPLLAERDLRVRSHAAALTRFYLDAMLGLVAIRAHSAERSLRREHEKLLTEWTKAALRLQRVVVSTEAVQLTVTFFLVAWLVLSRTIAGAQTARLLLVYWALNLPVLGQEIASIARQFPSYRNLTLRLVEPLRAPEEPETEQPSEAGDRVVPPCLHFRDVSVQASGHSILRGINLDIQPGSHVAIVGRSGAGKSSLVGILLGWLKPHAGQVLVNGSPLDCDQLRLSTAWVDPAVQIWNRSFFENLTYSTVDDAAPPVRRAIDGALLRSVLETLPRGLQTKLGEGGALLSGGEGQRVRFGRAMLREDAGLVILDEPFRGLDREKRRELLQRARDFWRASTLLCVTHDIEETQQFDRVLVIENGRIVEDGTPAELCCNLKTRYFELLEAERQTRSGLWSSRLWRRIHVHSGRIVEQVPEPEYDSERETEVA